ncbi:MAG: aldo/keto reductase [Acidobacteria bacterium]|nr:aldo/keto reductase [Acidobacteriota bacterium]MBI1983306.1 aldo/keto reductase [Acidobacteriota bacterium]
MNRPIARRDFLKDSLALAAGAVALPAGLAEFAHAFPTPPADDAEWRNKQAGMRYRRLGRTGIMISEIVCGGDPIASENHRHVELAIEMGLNYLDTAPAYGQGKSEEGYGEVLKKVGRERVFLTTKVSPFQWSRNQAYRKIFETLSAGEQAALLREASEDIEKRRATLPNYMGNYFVGQFRQIEEETLSDVMEGKYGSKIDRRATYIDTIMKSVDESLRRLGTDYVDILMCPHGASSYAETQIPEIYEAYEKLRKAGKVRFLGVTAHNDPAGVLKGAVDSGVYSLAMIAYNFVNRAYVEPVLEEAKKKDFGVIAMKTAQSAFQPGRENQPVPERVALLNQLVPGELNTHQKAYKFGLSNPNLSAVISNLVNEQQVKENLAVISA